MAGWYDTHVLPGLLDFACGLGPIRQRRAALIPLAQGRVLEVGMGTGLNLPHYDRQRVQQLHAVDPAAQMHAKALRRSAALGLPVTLHALEAEGLPWDDGHFDTVVCTYTLCSVADPLQALREMHRVLRPQGQLLFAEHGLAPDAAVQRWQRRLEPGWSRWVGGCQLTRDVPALLREAGFGGKWDSGYITRPHSLAYNTWGRASAVR